MDRRASWLPAFDKEPKPIAPIRVIANIGKLDATANRDGLLVLANEMLPLFRVAANAGGKSSAPTSSTIMYWDASSDLDGCSLGGCPTSTQKWQWRKSSSADFNASPYKIGHTRYLHAMSLGCCIVAHQDVRLSMPELVHRENCLLGSTVAEVASLVQEAALNQALRSALSRARVKNLPRKIHRPGRGPADPGKIEIIMSLTIGITGLDYVGLPLACALPNRAQRCWASTSIRRKFNSLARAESYIRHIGAERIASAVKAGTFSATTGSFLVWRNAMPCSFACLRPLTQSRAGSQLCPRHGKAHRPAPAQGRAGHLESTTYGP